MRKKGNIGMGPGAASLIMIFVMLSMSVLAMLSLMNSRNDVRLSDRSAEVAGEIYTLNEAAEFSYASIAGVLADCREKAKDDEEYLAEVKKSLPDGKSLYDREISWIEEDEGHMLDLAVEVLPFEEGGAVWIRHSLQTQLGADEFEDW